MLKGFRKRMKQYPHQIYTFSKNSTNIMYHQSKEIAIDAVLIDRFFRDGSIICL